MYKKTKAPDGNLRAFGSGIDTEKKCQTFEYLATILAFPATVSREY